MVCAKELIKRYKEKRKAGVKLADMDAATLAGYYLHVYPGGPVSALVMDMDAIMVPSTVALAAKELICSVR